MKTKRALARLVVLAMVVSLFAGLTPAAGALDAPKVSPASFSPGAGGGTYSFTVTNYAGNYTLLSIGATVSWIAITQKPSGANGGKCTFTVSGNPGGARSGKITVTASSNYIYATTNIPVSQAAKTYTVSYNANGGSGAPASQTKTHGVTLTLSSKKPTRTGYTFNGWNTNSSGTGTNYASGGTYSANATVTLYAKWKANTYSVKYNANGGTGTMANSSHTYGTAKALTANAFTRTGCTFQGWAASASGAVKYTNKQSVSNLTSTNGATVNLYAVWKYVYKVGVNEYPALLLKTYCYVKADAIIQDMKNKGVSYTITRQQIAEELYGHAVLFAALSAGRNSTLYILVNSIVKGNLESMYTSVSNGADIENVPDSRYTAEFSALWVATSFLGLLV